jgi:hypothetical protein
VVIDWTNARIGHSDADVALAWLLMGAGNIPGGRLEARLIGLGRSLMTNQFLSHFDRDAVIGHMHAVATWKSNDPNLTTGEVESLWRAVRRAGAMPGG